MNTDTEMTYNVHVQGQLDNHWADWLGNASLIRNEDGTSTLRICVADQAQLHGILTRLRDIGVTLLSLETSHWRRIGDSNP